MKVIEGIAQETKMAKTAVVRVERMKSHPKYQKKYKVSKMYYAHDPEGRVKPGEKVFILESRPFSKLKRWIVITKERALAIRAKNAAAKKSA